MKKIIYSYHSFKRMIERDLNEETIPFVLEQPDYTIERFGERESYKRLNGRTLKIVFVEK